MDSELLLKFIGYFPDYLSALWRTLYSFFGQPLSKQLYMKWLDVQYHAKVASPLDLKLHDSILEPPVSSASLSYNLINHNYHLLSEDTVMMVPNKYLIIIGKKVIIVLSTLSVTTATIKLVKKNA